MENSTNDEKIDTEKSHGKHTPPLGVATNHSRPFFYPSRRSGPRLIGCGDPGSLSSRKTAFCQQ